MKQARIFLLLAVLVFAVTTSVQGAKSVAAASPPQAQQSQQPAPTIASTVDREISNIEKEIVEAAEAMPEDTFNFSPESLNIPGDDYRGVRSCALQVKHVAASNCALWSPLTGCRAVLKSEIMVRHSGDVLKSKTATSSLHLNPRPKVWAENEP